MDLFWFYSLVHPPYHWYLHCSLVWSHISNPPKCFKCCRNSESLPRWARKARCFWAYRDRDWDTEELGSLDQASPLLRLIFWSYACRVSEGCFLCAIKCRPWLYLRSAKLRWSTWWSFPRWRILLRFDLQRSWFQEYTTQSCNQGCHFRW